MTVPIPFEGSRSEKLENYKTHSWMVTDPDEPLRCLKCDAASYMYAAVYPCGTVVPTMEIHND